MSNSKLKDRLVLVTVALLIVVVAMIVIDRNGGLAQIVDNLLSGSLERICKNDPNNPECKAATKALKEQPLTSPSPQPTQK